MLINPIQKHNKNQHIKGEKNHSNHNFKPAAQYCKSNIQPEKKKTKNHIPQPFSLIITTTSLFTYAMRVT